MVSMGFYIVGKRVYEDYVNMLACICLLVYACVYAYINELKNKFV